MDSIYIKKENIDKFDSWLPENYLCKRNEVTNFTNSWTTLKKINATVLDGWRFSENMESDWYKKHITNIQRTSKATLNEIDLAERYEQTIKQSLFYRMRHIEPMKLNVESHLMRPPSVDHLTSCVKKGDVLIRRIGSICASIVSNYHRQHPVDANVAIIRGLELNQAIWLSFCLNQLWYRRYLEQIGASKTMIRVGVKQLEQIPIAEMPTGFVALAKIYYKKYSALAYSQERLYNLRLSVNNWLTQKLSGSNFYTKISAPDIKSTYIQSRHINDQLTYAASWQASLSEELISDYNCQKLTKLALINPKSKYVSDPLQQTHVVKISDINSQLSVNKSEQNGFGWRTLKSTLMPFDVLISTFVQEPRVAIIAQELKTLPLVSEQLAILRFHHAPGAYALLMETELITEQMRALAHGTTQRFIQHKMLEQIVIPEIEQSLAYSWHQQLLELQQEKEMLEQEISLLLEQMYSIYRTIHPEKNITRKSNEPIH